MNSVRNTDSGGGNRYSLDCGTSTNRIATKTDIFFVSPIVPTCSGSSTCDGTYANPFENFGDLLTYVLK